MRQVNISGLHHRRHGVGARDLAAFRRHGDQARYIVLQFLDYGRSIGLVLHQLGRRFGPALRCPREAALVAGISIRART